jgi:hypothetical protein
VQYTAQRAKILKNWFFPMLVVPGTPFVISLSKWGEVWVLAIRPSINLQGWGGGGGMVAVPVVIFPL